MYDVESHIAELYDIQENQADDTELIRKLIKGRGSMLILEPFCGTGRIFLPLAADGHGVTGLDMAQAMLDRAAEKISGQPAEIRNRINLQLADVIEEDWPAGFDLVILGGNCFYELATAEEQEICVRKAMNSLKPGGYVYIDNGHMEGELASSWIKPGISESFPTGICSDGTDIRSFWEVVWYDIPQKLVRFRRKTVVMLTDGNKIEKEYVQQKHPVSMGEVQDMLESTGFVIEKVLGDRAGNPYNEESPRAIFWARKP